MTTSVESRLQAALEAIKSGSPPVPASSRFKPLRMGLCGIWQYAEQEFYFHDGRLALLGRNGSGKTKVLEVTSPFLFDANLTARRLDPFGHDSRSMRDNLLYDGQTQQVGYVWCEYGRTTESGQPEYVTIGAGLRAQASKSGSPDSWYFLTSRRVGVDFRLFDEHRAPASKADLVDLLEVGQVFTTADEYRKAVGERLFGMPPARYRSLVELLLMMRKPKLSENFGVDRLAETISEGLPPVDPGQIDELARGFDELSRDREDLADLERVGREVNQFLRVYRTYARRTVRHYAAGLRSASTRYDNVTRRQREAEQQLDSFQAALDGFRKRMAGLDRAIVEQRARVNALEQRPELEQQAMLLSLDQQARKAEEQASRAASRLAEVLREYELTETELHDAEAQFKAISEQFEDEERRAAALAEDCGLRGEHDVHSRRLLTDIEAAKRILASVIESRRAAIRNARALRTKVDQSQHEFDRAQETKDDLAVQKQELATAVVEQQAALSAEIEAVSTAIMSWAEDCRELEIPGELLEQLLHSVEQAGRTGVESPAAVIRRHAVAAEMELLETLAWANAEHQRLRGEHGRLIAQRRSIAAEVDPPPPEPHAPRRDRDQEPIPGAPLWRIVDFAPGTPDYLRANVETALLGAGLLDAWIIPDGTVVEPDTLEVLLRPGRGGDHARTLTAVLEPAEQDQVEAEAVAAALDRIGFYDETGPDQTADWIGGNGSWSLGPLRGRTEGQPASYIGAVAREAARRRRLQEIDRELDELEAGIAAILELHQQTEARIETLRAERETCPDDARIVELTLRLDSTLERTSAISARLAQAERRCEVLLESLRKSTAALETYGREHYIGTTLESLDALDEHLMRYREQLAEVFTQSGRHRLSLSQAESLRSRFARVASRREETSEEHQRTAEDAIALRSEYETRHELIGADIEQVIAELGEAREQTEQLRQERSAVEEEISAATEGLGSARATLQAVEESRREREAERAAASADFERLRTFGLLALAEVPGVQEGPAGLTAGREDARTAEQHLQGEDMDDRARNLARNAVDERFRALQLAIAGPDWNPWGAHEGDLFIVKVTHNGEDRAIPQVSEIIQDEIIRREAYLDEQERELFADVLIGRVGEHLRECRARATRLYEAMNELLSKRRTASGRQMRLLWEADPEAGPKVQRALELFDQQSMRLLSDEARKELVDFLAERVRETRDADQEGDWREHLREALDYRKWSRFRIQIRDREGVPWTNLNDAKHRQGSGGEKAVMLQLPLFVAAAAHYVGAAATAPRPIYLDEAFAGIDAEMRGECMKLLVDLDLDFILASHDEWGFHEEVPGLITYSLFRDPAIPGVLATPFLWNGSESSELSDPMLSDTDVADPNSDRMGLFNDRAL